MFSLKAFANASIEGTVPVSLFNWGMIHIFPVEIACCITMCLLPLNTLYVIDP